MNLTKESKLNFDAVKNFLESWGMGFDTPDGDSSTLPYPEVYIRLRNDAEMLDPSGELSKFVGRITDTTDSQTYLTLTSWDEIEEFWNSFP